MSSCLLQEFAHPQARFLHEKQYSPSRRVRHHLHPFFSAVNRASFKAIDGAMFVGTVSPASSSVAETLYNSVNVAPCFLKEILKEEFYVF